MRYAEYYQFLFFLIISSLMIGPIGYYIFGVFAGKKTWIFAWIRPIEQGLYRLMGQNAHATMNWKQYASAILWLTTVGFLFSYFILRNQDWLPLNPQQYKALSPTLAFHVTCSFLTNTDWQAYSGEQSLSYLSQLCVCTLQGFISAGTGLAVLMAVVRGFKQQHQESIGNFWQDLTKSILYILLPFSIVIALCISQQGVVQNIQPYQKIYTLEHEHEVKPTQIIPMGPVASWVAIKNLGTNGGGFFNVNSAHPFENPTPLTDLIELLSMIVLPAALVITFGLSLHRVKESLMILSVMFAFFIPPTLASITFERQGHPAIAHLQGMDQNHSNMEGKEMRLGVGQSALWAMMATATSTGSSNASYESLLPSSSMMCMMFMALQEIVFGGVGSGLYNMLMLMVIAVLLAALMVGRSPHFLGKKIESFEIKMAAFSIIFTPSLVLLNTAWMSCADPSAIDFAQGTPHGLSQLLYNALSMMNNNGSSFSGMNLHSSIYELGTGFCMLLARFWIMMTVLALAGSMSLKGSYADDPSSLKLHHPIFIVFLMAIIFLIGALSYLPVLAIGPVIEWLQLGG